MTIRQLCCYVHSVSLGNTTSNQPCHQHWQQDGQPSKSTVKCTTCPSATTGLVTSISNRMVMTITAGSAVSVEQLHTTPGTTVTSQVCHFQTVKNKQCGETTPLCRKTSKPLLGKGLTKSGSENATDTELNFLFVSQNIQICL